MATHQLAKGSVKTAQIVAAGKLIQIDVHQEQ